MRVPVLAVEQHLAEKVHAYTRSYGPANPASTRPKDLIDIVLLAEAEFPISAGRLKQALQLTFAYRATHPLPSQLPAPPPRWATAYRAMAQEVSLPSTLAAAHAVSTALINPILGGDVEGERLWDAAQQRWDAGAREN